MDANFAHGVFVVVSSLAAVIGGEIKRSQKKKDTARDAAIRRRKLEEIQSEWEKRRSTLSQQMADERRRLGREYLRDRLDKRRDEA